MSQFILATGGYDSTVRLFDAQNASLLRTFQLSDPTVLQLCFSGAGPVDATEPLYLAVGGSPRVAVFDASNSSTSGNPLFVFEGHTHPVTTVGFDTAIRPAFGFSASEDGTLQVWNPGLAAPPPSDGAPNTSPSGARQNKAGPHARAAPARQAHSGARPLAANCIKRFDNGHAINAACYDPASKAFFTVDVEGCLCAWNLDSDAPFATVRPRASRLKLHIQTLELSADAAGVAQYLIMADIRGNVFMYSLAAVLGMVDEEPKPIAMFNALDPAIRGKKTFVTRTRVSVDGSVLAITLSTGKIKIYSMAALEEFGKAEDDEMKALEPRISLPQTVPGHAGFVWDAVFVGDANNYIFTCGSDSQVILWNLDDGTPSDYPGHNKAVVCLAIKEQYSVGSLTSAPA